MNTQEINFYGKTNESIFNKTSAIKSVGSKYGNKKLNNI